MNNPQTFILVDDAAAGRRLRRFFAEQSGTVVARIGTWPDLVAQANSAYLLGPQDDWQKALLECLAKASAAFWHASYQVDPSTVANTVEQAWRNILCASLPGAAWPTDTNNARIEKRLADLNALNDVPINRWPQDLATMHAIVQEGITPHRAWHVLNTGVEPGLDAWQQALIERLNADAGDVESNLPELLEKFEQQLTKCQAAEGSRLHFVQSKLFSGEDNWPDADGSCEFIGVRDPFESVETAAGLIQQRCANNSALNYSDFALMLPRDYTGTASLAQSFAAWGIPLAQVYAAPEQRDLGHELLRFALMRFEGPIPSMALKSLMTNPLMPWPKQVGQRLADTLDQFGFGLKPPRDMPAQQRQLVELLDGPVAIDAVSNALTTLTAQMSQADILEPHRRRALQAALAITGAIAAGEQSWAALRGLCAPQPVVGESINAVSREGVAVIHEGETPWRTVRELLVLDFVDGHYPQASQLPLVFSPKEWRSLAHAGLPIKLPRESMAEARATLKMQLRQVSERVSFLIPRLNNLGDSLNPSATLTDMALMEGDADAAEELILALESSDERVLIGDLPQADERTAEAPRMPEALDLQLGEDLLARHSTSNEKPKPLSPSSLESLLVCPMGWLLKQYGAEPNIWEPEGFTPLTSGSLAHAVFETIFPKGASYFEWYEVSQAIPPAFNSALRDTSPFLSTTEWAVERQNLLGIIERAAEKWCEILNSLGATLVQPEIWLQGTFDNVAIHGQADAVLSLAERGTVVVDYKTAKADKYQQRMQAQMDLQASLYREMLKTGGPKQSHQDVAGILKSQALTGVAYYTLRDQKTCSDFQPFKPIAGWRFHDHDVSSAGLALLRERFEQLRRGEILLPRADDLKRLDKAGIQDYALHVSPLAEMVLDEESA